ncbi:Uu.00g130010.m01.CDS01 [Anthostomella pinea]|uniref:Uu.00g130010.m01.CDS01 n=1 Tax=Anthostomella pinea TaxID=933095 RepID=A0AAI8VIP5_9PEZI|nr:Uu.00g130010.m01.CDS01 [Anthostomella pinea]
MSFYDRQGIPESLLQSPDKKEGPTSTPNRHQRSPALHDWASDQESSNEDVESDSSMDNQFEKDVSTLRDYSFISIVEDGKTFEMHSLVQLATRQWLEAAGRQEQWKSQFIRRLNARLPTGAYENWAICRALLPHAVSAAAQRPKDRVSLEAWTSILYKAAWYLQLMGQGPEAQSMAEDAMKYRTKILGRTHEESLAAIDMVGQVYNLRGQWSPAEELFVEVMETRKQKLGPDHPDTLGIMNNLALTYRNQGRWEEAEKLGVEVMETCKQKLGPDHPDTLTSMANLASTTDFLGDNLRPFLHVYVQLDGEGWDIEFVWNQEKKQFWGADPFCTNDDEPFSVDLSEMTQILSDPNRSSPVTWKE